MATGKNKIIVYQDWIDYIEDLKNEDIGILFRTFFEYVNDRNPQEPEKPVLKLAWKMMRNTLKRDLKKWEKICETNKANGLLGGRPKTEENPKKPNGYFKNPKKPDSDSDSDIDSDTENDSEIRSISLPIENYKEDFFNDNSRTVLIAKNMNRSFEEIQGKKESFIIKCQIENKLYPGLDDVISHFNNWVQKQDFTKINGQKPYKDVWAEVDKLKKEHENKRHSS